MALSAGVEESPSEPEEEEEEEEELSSSSPHSQMIFPPALCFRLSL